MAPLSCCGFRRTISPDPQPVRLVDTTQPNKRFALSSHSVTPTENIQDAVPNHDIHASGPGGYEENGHIDSSIASGQDLLHSDHMKVDLNHRHSSRKLHDVASQVKKRMSLDSGMSKRSSKRTLRSSMSIEDTKRRAELRRALHKRVKDSVEDDSTTEDDHYDEDAIRIKTPRDSLGRQGGSVKVSPRYLSNVLKRSESPSTTPRVNHYQRNIPQDHAANNTATALSRILTQRAGSLSDEHERQIIDPPAETPTKSQKYKYVFEDEDTPRPVSKPRSHSSLGRTRTTIIRETPGTKKLEPSLSNPAFLHHDAEGLPLSDSDPSRVPSNDYLVVDNHLVSSKAGQQHPQANPSPQRRPLAASLIDGGIYDTKIRPASEDWLHGASGKLSPPKHSRDVSTEYSTSQDGPRRYSYDPSHEEVDFGGIDGIDGIDDSPPASIYHTARTRNRSEGNMPTKSAHIYNVHVPKRLVSKPLLPLVSLPQIDGPRPRRSFISGGSNAFSVKSHGHLSSSSSSNHRIRAPSSEVPSPEEIPLAWDNPHWRNSSSVYSSQPESLMSSQQSSLQRIASLQDRLQQIKAYTPTEEIISVPASRGKSIDLDKLEQKTSDVSYHSSSESLIERELAAAETRIAPLPRVNTLPKSSRFKEELDQISTELAQTNPIRRRFSNLDGSGEWNRASKAIGDRNTASIWERAIREHSIEDAALKHTRLGSEAPEGIGPLDHDFSRRSMSDRKASTQPSLESPQNDLSAAKRQRPTLQDRLASYRLPAPIPIPPKEPAREEPQRSASIRSTSSWARYPSHTRQERSLSPAGEQDQVFTRDFANMTPEKPVSGSPGSWAFKHGKEKEATSFGQQVLSSIKHVYRTQSQELQRRLANEARGHRSSISQGGVLEYPELEMLGSMSPPSSSPDIDTKLEMEEVLRKVKQPEPVVVKKKKSSRRSISPFKTRKHSEEDQARRWSKVYEDCVVDPTAVANTIKVRRSTSEKIGPRDGGGKRLGRGRAGSRRGEEDLRASTLDFKRSLELDERGAREKVLEMIEGRGMGGEGEGSDKENGEGKGR